MPSQAPLSIPVALSGLTCLLPAGGRIFAIGDIHGCHEKLTTLLDRLPYDPGRDTLVFLGDYLDRGPQASQVIEHICRLRQLGAQVVTLLGNHEHLLREYLRSGDPSLPPFLRQLGSEHTLASYGAPNLAALTSPNFLPAAHRRFLEELVPFWQTDDYIFVHAGLEPGRALAEQDPVALCEIRGPFLSADVDFGKLVIFGHTPFASPLVTPFKIGIDTGAVYGNLLTALELPARRFYHA